MVRDANALNTQEEAIARRVRQARQDAGLTLKEVGRELGLSEVGYGHYERCERPLGVSQLFVLSHVLNRSVSWFLGLDTGLTDAEDELLTCFRNTDDSGQNAVLSVARSMARERPRS